MYVVPLKESNWLILASAFLPGNPKDPYRFRRNPSQRIMEGDLNLHFSAIIDIISSNKNNIALRKRNFIPSSVSEFDPDSDCAIPWSSSSSSSSVPLSE